MRDALVRAVLRAVLAEERGARIAGHLDVARDADAEVAALLPQLGLPRPNLVVADPLERQLEAARVVAAS